MTITRRCPWGHEYDIDLRECPTCKAARARRYDMQVRTPESKSFLRSRAWRNVRARAMTRDHYICQECDTPTGESGHGDHIKPRETHPELALDVDNVQTLCERCHGEKTRRGE